MYNISKVFEFSAGHHLEGLPADHPCTSPHGHNYTVELHLEAYSLNAVGFVVDYRELSEFKRLIDNTYDHKDLNNVVDFNPTAENLAKHFYMLAKQRWSVTKGVTVSETPKTKAYYSEP